MKKLNRDSNMKSSVLLAVTVVALGSPLAQAQTWTGDGTTSQWGDANNWSPATVPNATGAVANLTGVINSSTSVYMGGNTYTLGTLNIGSTGTSPFNLGYNNGSEGTLTFSNNGNGTQIQAVGNGGDTINGVAIQLTENLTINDNQTGTTGTPYGFEIGYSMATTFSGTGNLILNNNNLNGSSFGTDWPAFGIYGAINNTGMVVLSGMGTGSVAIRDKIGSQVTELDQSSATSSTVLGGFGDGGFNGTTTIKITAGQLSFSSGSGYDKPASVIVGDTSAHGGSNSDLDVRGNNGWTMGSAQRLSGFGTIIANPNQAVVAIAGSVIAPGSAGHIGTLTFNGADLQLQDNATLSFLLGSTGNNSSLSLNDLNIAALHLHLELTDNAGADGLGSLGLGTYDLASYHTLTGAAAGDLTSLFTIDGPNGFSYSVSATAMNDGTLELTVSEMESAPEPSVWSLFLAGFGVLFGMRTLRLRRRTS